MLREKRELTGAELFQERKTLSRVPGAETVTPFLRLLSEQKKNAKTKRGIRHPPWILYFASDGAKDETLDHDDIVGVLGERPFKNDQVSLPNTSFQIVQSAQTTIVNLGTHTHTVSA